MKYEYCVIRVSFKTVPTPKDLSDYPNQFAMHDWRVVTHFLEEEMFLLEREVDADTERSNSWDDMMQQVFIDGDPFGWNNPRN